MRLLPHSVALVIYLRTRASHHDLFHSTLRWTVHSNQHLAKLMQYVTACVTFQKSCPIYRSSSTTTRWQGDWSQGLRHRRHTSPTCCTRSRHSQFADSLPRLHWFSHPTSSSLPTTTDTHWRALHTGESSTGQHSDNATHDFSSDRPALSSLNQ